MKIFNSENVEDLTGVRVFFAFGKWESQDGDFLIRIPAALAGRVGLKDQAMFLVATNDQELILKLLHKGNYAAEDDDS